jgi:hypothetical protein
MVQGQSVINIYRGILSDVEVLPDTNQFGALTDYSVYFTSMNVIPKGSYVDIEFPKDHFSGLGDIECKAIKTANS